MTSDATAIREAIQRLNDAENSLSSLGLEAMIAVFDEILGEDWQGAANGGPYHSRADEREAERALFTAFPDYRRTIDLTIVEPPRAAFQWTFTGTHTAEFAGFPPTGNTVTVSGVSVVEFNGGRMNRSHQFVDVGGFLAQLQS